jgi:hypothetical protein
MQQWQQQLVRHWRSEQPNKQQCAADQKSGAVLHSRRQYTLV